MPKVEMKIDGALKDWETMNTARYTKQIGGFDVVFADPEEINGLETVQIYEEGVEVFRGECRVPKTQIGKGRIESVSGPEWTAKLKNKLTPYYAGASAKRGITLTECLGFILENTGYAIGTLDELTQSESAPETIDTSLDFLEFSFSNANPVYGTTIEIEDTVHVATIEVPANSKWTFHSTTTGYFYAVVFEQGIGLHVMGSTDFVTWIEHDFGFAANAGDNGTYGVAWDDAAQLMYLIVDDTANIDFYEYSEDGDGTWTQTDTDANVDAGNIELGPILDGEGDVFWICNDGSNYVLWQFDISDNTWTAEKTWAISSNDDPRWMFKGESAGDINVIMWNDDADDLEEWLYDESLSTFAEVYEVVDTAVIVNDLIAGVAGAQDINGNMYLVYEDEITGDGDAELFFTYRTVGATSWSTPVKILDDDNYQTQSKMSMFVDGAQNIYLFYLDDTGATQNLKILRRFEETWDSAVTLSTSVDTSTFVGAPGEGIAGICMWIDDSNDCRGLLLAPYAIGLARAYGNPEEEHSYEAGLDFDNEATSSGASMEASTEWSSEGNQSLKSYTPGYSSGQKNAFGRYNSPDHNEIWVRSKIKVTEADNWGTSSADDNAHMVIGFGGSGLFYAGWGCGGSGTIVWRLLSRDGASYTSDEQGTPEIGQEYCIEVHWYKHSSAGFCYLYVDGALMCSLTGIDTDNYGNVNALFIGTSSNQRDGATTVYHDEVAWGAEGNNRVGCSSAGYFQTATITASGSFNDWGTLDSTDDDDDNTVWSVWDDAPVLIVAGLVTGVNLLNAGVPDTELNIQIRADMQQGISGNRNYVFDIKISELQGLTDLDVDKEEVNGACVKQANLLGYEYRLNYTNEVDFVQELGKDKSDKIIFKTSGSKKFASLRPNIEVFDYDLDFDNFANAVLVIGAGTAGVDRIEATAQDAESQEEYGEVIWKRLDNRDATTLGLAQTFGSISVSNLKVPLERFSGRVFNHYGPDLEIGDYVWVVAEEKRIDGAFRVVGMSKSYRKDSMGTDVTLDFANRPKGYDYVTHSKKVLTHERWIIT